MVSLESARLILREVEKRDEASWHKFASDLEVVKYEPWGPNTIEDTKQFIKRSIERQRDEPRENYSLAVEHPIHGLIGGCGIYITSFTNKSGYIGFVLNKDFWGKGYGTAIAGSLIEYGFCDLELHRIEATCDIENIGSRKVLENNGMQREGTLRHLHCVRGEWRDSFIYSISEHEWKRARSSH
jgi:RimJ/RimL family protein N-acetyltransferase